MRRIKILDDYETRGDKGIVLLYRRDYRLLCAVVRAATDYVAEYDPIHPVAKRLSDAVDAFNAPRKP